MRFLPNRGVKKSTHRVMNNRRSENGIENLEARTLFAAATPDLALSVSSSPASVVAGTNATYVFTTTNIGKAIANPVMYVPPVGYPAGCKQLSFTLTSGTIALKPGATQTFTLVLSVDPSVANGTNLNFPIEVVTKRDTNLINNEVMINTPVTASADINIVVSGPAQVTRGTEVTFDIATINAGPSTETTGYYTPPAGFPDGLTQLSYTLASGPGFGLAPGDQDVYALVMSVPANITSGTVLSFPALLTGGVTDPDLANNTATISTTVTSQVVQPVSIALSSSAFNETSTLGAAVSFTAAVTPVTAGATPTGTVTFTDASTSTVLGTEPVGTDGTATLPDTTAFTGGYHTIIASYSGDGTYGATTKSLTQVVTVPVPSTVVPVLGKVSLPISIVAGAKFKAVVPVGITNDGPKQAGIFTINLFANTSTVMDGNQVAIAAPIQKQLTLLTDRHAGFVFHPSVLPATLPAGTYHLLVEVVDANGLTNVVATTQTITTAAPFVSLAATATAVTPATIALKKSGTIVVSLTNNGNVNAVGSAVVTLAPSIDQATAIAGVVIDTLTVPRPTTIKPGKTVKFAVHFKHTAALASGTFFPYVTIAFDNQTLTVIGSTPFTLV